MASRAMPRNRGDVDDRSIAAGGHAECDGLHQPKRAFQVDLDHLVELCFVGFQARTKGNIHRGVVYQHIDWASDPLGRTPSHEGLV